MKNKKLVIKSIIAIFLLIYFLLIVLLYNFILKENKYGISENKDKAYVIINKYNESDKYTKGSLVVVKKKNIDSIKIGDEIFTYKSDKNNNVYVSISVVEDINLESDPKYYILKGDEGNYKNDSIIGSQIKTINYLGSVLYFFTNKIVFLVLVIIPILVLIMYEVYHIFNLLNIGIETKLNSNNVEKDEKIENQEKKVIDNNKN